MENIIDRLEYFMAQVGLNDNRLTTEAGLSVGLIGKARKIRKGLHSDTIEKILYRYPELSSTWFLMGKGEWNDVHPNAHPDVHPSDKLPVLNEPIVKFLPQTITVNQDNEDVITVVGHKAAAGYLNGYSDPEFIEKLPTLSAPGFKNGVFRAFEIRGGSMPPLHSGSFSIGEYVDSITDIRNRRVYIIVTKYDGIVIKRVINVPEEKKLIIISDNPNKKEFPNDIVDYEDILEIWYWRGALIRELPDPSDLYARMNDMEARMTLMEGKYRQISGR